MPKEELTRLYTMRCSERWYKRMQKKAARKSKIRRERVVVADLIREACRKQFKVAEGAAQ